MDDSPGMPLFSNDTEASESFSATMYLMWQPNLSNSIPVPLGSVTWQCQVMLFKMLDDGLSGLEAGAPAPSRRVTAFHNGQLFRRAVLRLVVNLDGSN